MPDSTDDVVATLLFVRNLQKEELAFAKKGKLLEVHEYVVKEGDTLWGISGKFDLDVDTLVGCNQQVLGGSIHRLKLGMKLRVPNQDGVFVKVAKNDTLGKLADKYGSSSDAVKLANAMKSDKLILGEEIFLPGGKLIADTEVRIASKDAGASAAPQSRSPEARAASAGRRWDAYRVTSDGERARSENGASSTPASTSRLRAERLSRRRPTAR